MVGAIGIEPRTVPLEDFSVLSNFNELPLPKSALHGFSTWKIKVLLEGKSALRGRTDLARAPGYVAK